MGLYKVEQTVLHVDFTLAGAASCMSLTLTGPIFSPLVVAKM